VGKVRVDQLLVARGLADSRARAQAAIEAGGVRVGGMVVAKPAQAVDADADVTLEPPHPWVSRAGVKLAFALERFAVSATGRSCLDLGASTGGFTEVLLAHGAARVCAVDVGRGQMHPKVQGDPRVLAVEGKDARALTADEIGFAPELIVCDASFISLRKLLPAPLALAAPRAELLALVKPHYERDGPGGPAMTPATAFQLAETVAHALDGLAGFAVQGLTESPIVGGDGAVEFLLHARRL
jgi:23S rRNA (cytidine1920-2'-O)/16S rRNA (cytidine1409-2'-O)-methyltransferase